MSRGLGRVQRGILALTKAQTGPWTVEELCRLVYPAGGNPPPSRSQLVAVSRALKSVRVPKWKVGRVGWDRRTWLYRDLASVERRIWAMETFVVTAPEEVDAPPPSSDDGWVTLTFDDMPETEIILTGLPDEEVP
jgi:hypothetical protein